MTIRFNRRLVSRRSLLVGALVLVVALVVLSWLGIQSSLEKEGVYRNSAQPIHPTYHQDPDTDICFAQVIGLKYDNTGERNSRSGGISAIECTEKVKAKLGKPIHPTYHQDPDTDICFAQVIGLKYDNTGERNSSSGGISKVNCTDKVLAKIAERTKN